MKTQIKNENDVRAILELISSQRSAQWIESGNTRNLDGGGVLTVRGFRCSHCGFFRRKKNGMSKFCEDCGFKMIPKEASNGN